MEQRASDNHMLGDYTISDIPSKPKGQEKIKIKFSVDTNGLLKVESTILSSGSTEMKVVKPLSINLSSQEVDEICLKSASY
mmetsp:Transcript_30346/g.40337  ORF Transcript_30346/g.40337 Transcript_30346/m.40337 type:complete len:81 (+) Transcript_30346:1683-1925(+)